MPFDSDHELQGWVEALKEHGHTEAAEIAAGFSHLK